MTAVVIERAAAEDVPAMLALLATAGLPTEGLVQHLDVAFVAKRGERVVGTAALEVYEGGGLLRSVAVDPSERGSGIGRLLTEHVLLEASAAHLPAVYLLTTTAEAYFPRFGFSLTTRESVPEAVRESIEFRAACPASATVMRKWLR